ncbi:MAG: AAA family ATPase, partial [Anaerolineales bacterium]|nr:AAA family ATPase [Anaerolineales bacterium]
DAALAKLREHLEWLPSLEGVLQSLKDRLADANRDLRRADDTNRARIEDDIAQLKKQIAEQERVVADPAAAAQRTAQSIERAIEREREPAKPISGISRTKFINPPPGIAPNYFQDRFEENKIVAKFLRDDSCRLLTVVGRAGIGKTAMVCRILKALESGRLPDDLGEMRVDGIVYLSAVGTRVVNVPNLFADLCQLLPADTARELDALYKNPQVATEAKINALAAAFPGGRIIVLLDNFENTLDAETMNLRDAELDDALRALLNAPHHAVKVMITKRIAPHDLGFVQPGRQHRLNLDNGLELPYAKNVLTENDADGTLGLKNAGDDLLARACEFTRGFPRALEALIAILRADRYTTLAEILANALPPDKVVEALVGEAFNRLDPNAQRVMQTLAVYNRPVTPAAVDYLLQPFVPNVDSAPVLNRLVTMQFARREAGRYYLHPTDRAYAFDKVKSEKAKGKSEEADWTQKDLLNRAADYFAATRKPRETWKMLTDLEPQLNEFDLRCAADDYDTAASVLLEIDFDYLLLWGHFRLMIELHEKLQEKIDDTFLQLQSL